MREVARAFLDASKVRTDKIRIPKTERNPKFEIRKTANAGVIQHRKVSKTAIGAPIAFNSGFGFRISAFGFPLWG